MTDPRRTLAEGVGEARYTLRQLVAEPYLPEHIRLHVEARAWRLLLGARKPLSVWWWRDPASLDIVFRWKEAP